MRKILLTTMLVVACAKQTTFSSNLNADDISGELHQETFVPNTFLTDKLDILIIIDGSDSMGGQRAEIARKLAPLLEHIKARDWQIGIASTDMMSCFATIINAKTPNYQDVYRLAIDAIRPSNSEQAIFMTIKGLRGMAVAMEDDTCNDNNPQYLVREGSAIGILIITDEDHQCDVIGESDAGCEIQDLYDFLSLIRLPHKTAKVYGFLNPSRNDKFLAWKDESGEPIFTRHEPYDTDSYDTILKAISSDLSDIVQYKYKLTKLHDDEASEVVIYYGNDNSKILNENEYGIVGKKLFILTALHADTSKVVVTYSYQP